MTANTEIEKIPKIKYDRWGRMLYHSEFHPNQGKSYSTKELSYICKHYSRGNVKTLSLDVGRTEHSLRQLANTLRKEGLFEHYKSLMVYEGQ
ncbi:DNA-entry nuclease [Paenibacillus anaericanus]|uniref:DNA-entry nuclease n=1 Tax=Paenibacillus anaericanus TaxID=170367 RepID=A0A433XVM1_9BACL|nr:DNA-entry nuclease [Paenibacillus anaericanus]RUT38714.1 DNA-entry nuclease [Paenibacillus anaericanus]